MAVLPAEIPTGLVTGQYYFVNEDNIDADTDPDLTVVSGRVTFVCEAAEPLRIPTKKAVLIPLAFDAEFNGSGQLVPKGREDIGIELPASDSPLFNPSGFTWKVTFDLVDVNTGFTVVVPSFSIFVPEGVTSDLVDLMPVATGDGVLMTQGPQGVVGPIGPEGPPLEAVVADTVTGPETPGIVGPQGVKGDPGGIVLGTVLASANLNTITTSGVYRQDNGTTPTLALNYPPTLAAGILVVHERIRDSSSQSVVQEYTPVSSTNGTPTIYRRYYHSNSTWTSWRAYNSTRVDETAGRAIYQWDDKNNREQLIYGDTGFREIATSHGINGVANSIKIRRWGNVVTLDVNCTIPDNTAANTYLTSAFPAGFTPTTTDYYGYTRPSAATTQIAHRVGPAGLQLSGPTWLAAWGTLRLNATWITNDTWPTTLPGTASGTIPNV